jgi:hypothetical protein
MSVFRRLVLILLLLGVSVVLFFMLFVRIRGGAFAVVPKFELITPLTRYSEYIDKRRARAQRDRIQYLKSVPGPDADKELIRIVEGEYVNDGTLMQAIYVLGERRVQDAVPAINGAMRAHPGDISVGRSAWEALQKIEAASGTREEERAGAESPGK